ncbi:MAG: 5-formyltetrahydrofolate cyclo-ligase [Nitrosopumilus sp. B06]|nr:MAG: 5-formyltetrahydrofolate cyclo-ligase [Nitrosopumilus sp. D6]RNJ78839.1 MAG: 5-formyltetrahydrofolate cyclo-ligase [Nitrosopumilus sp. B06]
MEDSPEKKSLRRLLLEKRDCTSSDLLEIASKKIQNRLLTIDAYKNAQKVGAYYSIGSEIKTRDMIQEVLSGGRDMFLPRVTGSSMEFKRIEKFSSLEEGAFGIMEPRDVCQTEDTLDVILVPTVGVSLDGTRLGYGHGYYDRYLAERKTLTISLTLEKQVIGRIPGSAHDVSMDWIVTEDRTIRV